MSAVETNERITLPCKPIIFFSYQRTSTGEVKQTSPQSH